MSEGLNRVILLGNLGADPELRFTGGGTAALNLRLATTESYADRDKKRQERTEWVNVVVWGKRAEALGKFLRKGATILVEGSLRTSSYENREGQKVYKTEVHATQVCLAGGGGRRDDAPAEEPRGQQRSAPRGRPEPRDEGGFGSGGGDDDIPF